MKIPVAIVLCLKIVFVVSAFLKLLTHGQISQLKTEERISRLLYYNASLLLFLYWFNPWNGKICLIGEDKMLVFSFMVIEVVEELFPKFG